MVKTNNKLKRLMPKTLIQLNDKQLLILKLIYKFRFVTVGLLSEYRSVSQISTLKSLNLLKENNYLNRKYEKNYKIDRIAARYSLTNKAFKLLKKDDHISKTVPNPTYYNLRASDDFINQSLEAMKLTIKIRQKYPDIFQIYSRFEIVEYPEFPKPLPNLYLIRRQSLENATNEYFIEIHDDLPLYLIKKRLRQLIDHFDNGDWPETKYPKIIFVLKEESEIKKLRSYFKDLLYGMGINESELSLNLITNNQQINLDS